MGRMNRQRSARSYPISSFVYLLSADLPPLFFRRANSAPPTTSPPNIAMITMGSFATSEDSLARSVDTTRTGKVPKVYEQSNGNFQSDKMPCIGITVPGVAPQLNSRPANAFRQ